MNAINIIVGNQFAADVGKVGRGAWILRIHISISIDTPDKRIEFSSQCFASYSIPFAHGQGDNPRMALHATFVTFFDGKFQGIVARRSARDAAEAAIPRLLRRRVDSSGPNARLNEYGVDTSFLIKI